MSLFEESASIVRKYVCVAPGFQRELFLKVGNSSIKVQEIDICSFYYKGQELLHCHHTN